MGGIFEVTKLKIAVISGGSGGGKKVTRTRLCLLNECVDKESSDPEDAKQSNGERSREKEHKGDSDKVWIWLT